MADINVIIQNLRDIIAADSATKVWTNATYGRDHKVFVGVDTRDPPGATDCPFVVISPDGKTGGWSEDQIRHIVSVDCEVSTDTQTVTTNKIEYSGVQEIETFRQKVLMAIKGMTAAQIGGRIDDIITTYETILFFPAFICDMKLTIVQDLAQGDDPIG
jgi:hypothetical protein